MRSVCEMLPVDITEIFGVESVELKARKLDRIMDWRLSSYDISRGCSSL